MAINLSNKTVSFAVDGDATGVITVTSTSGFATGATVYINATGKPTITATVLDLTTTTIKVRAQSAVVGYGIADLTGYTVAASASITVPTQSLASSAPVSFGPDANAFGDTEGGVVVLHEDLTVNGNVFATGTVTSGAAAGDVASTTGIFKSTGANTGALLRGNVNDGASAVGVKIVNTVALANATAKALSIFSDNGVTEIAYVLANGNGVFTGTVTGSNLSGTNTGNVTIGTANGLSLAGQALSLAAAGSAQAGALTSGAQTIGGAKTFNGGILLPTATTVSLNVGATTTLQDISGILQIDVANGKEVDVYINGSQEVILSAAEIRSKNGQFTARATTYGHVFMLQNQYGGSLAYSMRADPTDGAGNTAFKMLASPQGTSNALASADILQFASGSTTVGLVDKDGAFQFNVAGAAKPTAAAAHKGKIWYEPGGVGVTDKVYMCMKSAANTYSWVQITTGG